jgi:hypothetical protein
VMVERMTEKRADRIPADLLHRLGARPRLRAAVGRRGFPAPGYGGVAQQTIHVARHAPELLPGVISGKVKLKDTAEQAQRRSPAATAALAGLEHGA